MRFRDRIVIVTGAASGIGRALSQQLAKEGATIVGADLRLEPLEETMQAIVADGGKAEAMALDVTDAAAVKTLVDAVVEKHGRLDMIFNNAGVAAVGEVKDMGVEHWDWMIDVNVRGVIHGVLAAYPVMIRQGAGHIVNTASFAGLAPTPMMTAYATTKHAVVGLSRSLKAEAGAFGIKVSVVCPGIIDTPMIQANRVVGVEREILDDNMPMTPYSVDRCASDILNGVARSQHIIVVTSVGKLGYLLLRWAPWLVDWVAAREMRKNRAVLEAAKSG